MVEASILALDINDDAVAGVLYREGKRAPAIIAAHCRFLDASCGLEDALAEVVERCRGRGSRCLVSCDAAYFHYRSLRLPFSDRKKVRSILPYEIEDSISFNDEPFVFDSLIEAAGGEGSDIVAAMVKKERVRQWLDLLLDYDLDPELLTISGIPTAMLVCRKHRQAPDDGVLLYVACRRALLILIRQRTIRAIRSLAWGVGRRVDLRLARVAGTEGAALLRDGLQRLAIEADNTLLALRVPESQSGRLAVGLSGPAAMVPECGAVIAEELAADLFDADWQPFVEIENQDRLAGSWPKGSLDHALALACCPPRDRERLNFRRDEFAWKGGGGMSRPLRVGSLALLALICLLGIYQFVDYQKLKQERDNVTNQVLALYQQTVPESKPGRDPVREIQVKVNELRETATIGTGHDPNLTIVTLLADISERISPSLPVSFERLVYDRKTIRIRGLTDTFNTVDTMKKALERSPFYAEVSIVSANISQLDQQVRFELKLDL